MRKSYWRVIVSSGDRNYLEMYTKVILHSATERLM